jgi:hypothetical protein
MPSLMACKDRIIVGASGGDSGAVLAIHHPGHDGSRPRGHSTQLGNATGMIRMEFDPAARCGGGDRHQNEKQ